MKYLIINFYSPQNAGDLAILEQTVKLIRSCDAQAQIECCVSDTEMLPESADFAWVHSWNWVVRGPRRTERLRTLIRAYSQADVIISLGGGYFFVHDYRPASTYATLSLLAALVAHKRVLCFPQSFGPFRFRYQARLAASVLHGARALLIREERSMALLRQTDARLAARARLVPDTAFTLALESDAKVAADRRGNASRRPPQIGITLLDWESVNPLLKAQPAYERSMAEFIVYVWRNMQAHLTLFVQCRSGRRAFESDMGVTRRVAEIANGLDTTLAGAITIQASLITPADYVKAYGEMDYFIGTRMHSLIFAACSAVPMVAVGYQHKSLGLMQMLGLEHYHVEMAQLTSPLLIQKFDQGWAERDVLSARIRATTLHLATDSRLAMAQALQTQ